MKMFKKISLRVRITLLTATLLTICSVFLTIFSMYNAKKSFYPVLDENLVVSSGENLQGGVPAVSAKEQKDLFTFNSIYFCIIITGIGTLATYFIAGASIKPLLELESKVKNIDEFNLSERIENIKSKDEIGSLTYSFNRMLERLEDAFLRQKKFTASAAHELKTPIATIKCGMQVIKNDPKATIEDWQQNAVETVESMDRLTDVVNDLLLLAKTNEVEEKSENIYLDGMFESIFDELSMIYSRQNITYHISAKSVTMKGNLNMFYRAMYNLIENAYKYNKKNGTIDVSAKQMKDKIKIEIKDTGIGIEEKNLPFIFDSFYRVDESRNRKIAGSGLGLALVKKIIEEHNGSIEVESKINKGTKFIIIL